jgi:lipopolysaccharide/colanic/teichoic acid biosynthesis glycosyltransferase
MGVEHKIRRKLLVSFNHDQSSDTMLNGGLYASRGKRGFDLAVSAAALLILTPILVVRALLVRLTSGGPVFFRQTRLGLQGRPFRVFKFRTMRVGSDHMGAKIVVPGDQRLTLVGRTLRRIKLDQLPQLINVLMGDMSLAGSRPLVPEQVNVDNSQERELLQLRPGLTSYGSLRHRVEEEYCLRQDGPGAMWQRWERPRAGSAVQSGAGSR